MWMEMHSRMICSNVLEKCGTKKPIQIAFLSTINIHRSTLSNADLEVLLIRLKNVGC